MEKLYTQDILSLKSLHYQDEQIHDLIGGLCSPFNPLNLLPNPLLSEITTPPPSSNITKTFSSSFTEEDATHAGNLLLFGVDSLALPPHILTSQVATIAMPPCLDPKLLQPSAKMATSSVSPLSAGSTLFSPTTADTALSGSPPADGRGYSLVDPTKKSQNPTPGPSARRTKRSRPSYSGESSFRLDPSVPPRPPSKHADKPMGKPYSRFDSSASRCPARLTSNRAQDWRSCPYNPEARAKHFTCEICSKKFTREDNKKRHIENYH